MFCNQCGIQLNDTSHFCMSCGCEISQEGTKTAEESGVGLLASDHRLTLNCFGGKMLNPNYAYLFFYGDRVVVYSFAIKKMERNAHDYIKEEGKVRKIKLFERTVLRNQFIRDFAASLPEMGTDELSANDVATEHIYYKDMSKVVFQCNSSALRYDDEATYTTKTSGYISMKTNSGKKKFTHGYGYHKETNYILKTVLGPLVKIKV